MDPRIRRRRAEVDRARRVRRWKVGLLAGAVMACAGLLWWVLHSPIGSVRNVSVRGASHETPAQIASAAGIRRGITPILDVDDGAAARGVAALPWVASARVTRHWPWSVTITVTERAPVARVDAGGQELMVDASRRLLGPVDAAHPHLPLLVGVTGIGPAGSYLSRQYVPEVTVAASVPPGLASGISEVAPVPGGIAVDWGAGTEAYLGPPVQLAAKFEALATVLTRVSMAQVTRIDVSLPDLPTVTRGSPSPFPSG